MREEKNIVYFESLLANSSIVHGISTRAIGDMHQKHGHFQNASDKLAAGLGIASEQIVYMDQIHGKNIVWAGNNDAGKRIAACDGLLTREKNLFLYVVSADCIPLLLYEPDHQIVGVIHAGWKGVARTIVVEAIRQIKEKGGKTKALQIYVGPSICGNCYEVGPDVADIFRALYPEETGRFLKSTVREREYKSRREKKKKFLLNLQEVITLQFTTAGVAREQIEDSGMCTKENNTFFSHRRDHASGKCGVFASIIGIKS